MATTSAYTCANNKAMVSVLGNFDTVDFVEQNDKVFFIAEKKVTNWTGSD